jgi:glutamate-1-semialdehyde 2,1-aminomutase
MKPYEQTKSRELFLRATKVIPGGVYGHLGPAEGCFMPVHSYPLFSSRAQGPYFWDLDGNRFIDYMCAYGPNILGYNDPDVEAAALAQLSDGDCVTAPSGKMVELAELMVDTVAMADWAFFCKNGGDTTTFAVMIARAATGRDKVVLTRGGYHGVAPWMQKLGHPGITAQDVANNLSVEFGDFEALERVLAENKDQVACFLSTPYHHPVMEDNRLPPQGYWRKVRELCTREGVVLAIDDVRCGFRLDVHGSDAHYGFKADLMCFCKAIANGWSISALCGADSLKEAAGSVMYTGSYWLSAVPIAAAIACVTKMRAMNVAKVCTEKGCRLTKGLVEAGRRQGLDLVVSGEPAMWFMRMADDWSGEIHQAWVAECVRRGVFFVNHHNLFMNAAVSSEDVGHTLEVAEEAFAAVAKSGLADAVRAGR